MNETPFEQFITLVKVDQQINTLDASISALEKENLESLRLDESYRVILEKVKNKLHDMRKEVESKELEMKILDQQEVEKKKRIEHSANHKEYQLVKNEIDQLKKAQHALEDGLMDAWNQLETTKKEYEIALQEYERQHQNQQETIEKNNTQIERIRLQVSDLMADRLQKEHGIPAEWLEKYAIMRAKVIDPVVPVIAGNCTACFYQVSAQDMQFLNRRKLVQCKDCYRLLYLPEAQSQLASSQDKA